MRNSITNNDNASLLRAIERKAIDGSGCLGSFYDGHSDSIVQISNLNDKAQSFQSEDPVRCETIHGDICKSQNLLQIAEIQDDLRLNILMNLVSRTRIASIINHPYPINEYTRFIYYCYENRKEQLLENVTEIQKWIEPLNSKATATHIITGISWGIEVVVALQLRVDPLIIKQIDGILEKVQNVLNGSIELSSLTSDDDNVIRQSTQIIVYSNISYLNRMTSMSDICRFINNRNDIFKTVRPIAYDLKPIQLFYPQFTQSDFVLNQLDSTFKQKLEKYLLQYVRVLRDLKYTIDYKVARLLCGYLPERLHELQQQWINLKHMQQMDINRLKTLVSDIRHGRCHISMNNEGLSGKEQTNFKEGENGLTHDLKDLETKGQLITNLKRQQFQYCNVVERGIVQRDDETTIEQKLMSNGQYDRVICWSDALNKEQPEELQKMLEYCSKNPSNHSKQRLVYADFSYSSYNLTKMLILPLHTHKKDIPSSTEIPMPSSNIDTINILLLGESGVGKSTFINALANYLTFDTLEQAKSNDPVVLIPVSFLITVGHNFDERIVKFGDVDGFNNENFDHPGQSVTQYCKSYVFHMDRNESTKLRIIDTPGFGDTRGLDQDDRNMQHILEYISNLSHLNAICFLLKPNASQLHIFLQQCFTQLFDLLGPNLRNNIIFCFTSARSTFYTPGDTAPLLKKMLTSFKTCDIAFKKENTFCFDNESFRYLIASNNDIGFNDEEKHEYEMSWTTSVNQSNGLIDYIHRQLSPYHMNSELQSIKHAQLEIGHMIRPMLEAMRNILRNLILFTMYDSKASFNLLPKAIPPPATICTACIPYPSKVGSFWIVQNIPHKVQPKCYSCQCPLEQHIPIDYIIEYKFSNNSSESDQKGMNDLLHELCHASVDLAHFLTHTAGPSATDPFFIGLVQMITEEKYLCDNQKPNDFNIKLVDDLRELQKEYDQRMNNIAHDQGPRKLADIYKLISAVGRYPMVHEQLVAAKEGQKLMMKQYEYEVPQSITNVSNIF